MAQINLPTSVELVIGIMEIVLDSSVIQHQVTAMQGTYLPYDTNITISSFPTVQRLCRCDETATDKVNYIQ